MFMPRLSAAAALALPFVLLAAPAAGQVIDPELPVAITHRVQEIAAIERVALPDLDRTAINAEDIKRDERGLAPRFAIPIATAITPERDGSWEDVGRGARLWRLRISAPGALSINLGFSRFDMPEGGRLLIYATDFSQIMRPFTAADNETHGELWTPVILADDIMVEVFVPTDRVDQLNLELAQIGHGYRGFGAPADDQPILSGSCNVDVVCSEGDDWEAEISSVGVISTGGSTFCTGFMVNNTAQDLTPFFMTAAHCGISSGNAASLVVYWNYENSWCRPPGSPESGGPGDGSLSEFNTGSFFRSGYSSSDFTLVELDDDPNPDWQVGFAGWDRSGDDTPGAVAIHQPNTDEKRISFEDDPTYTSSYLGSSVPGDGTHVWVDDWDLGTTEPGSSGSPLFDLNHRVIGQLHGGYAACGNNLSDWYGRISYSWTGGGSPSSRLSDWLDPGGTGAMSVDTISGAGLSVSPAGDVLHIGLAGGPFTNDTIIYTLNNPSPNPVDYEVSLSAFDGVLIDGDVSPITGTLSPFGGSRSVTVTLGPDIFALPAGVYAVDVMFEDQTNSVMRMRHHVVEIGQTLIEVTPAFDFQTGGPIGGPFTTTQDYTVVSERPTPVTVDVVASESWIAINGSVAPYNFVLTGTGAEETVTIGFSAAADSLPAGLYTGNVTFTNADGGGGGGTRTITLDVGRMVFAAVDLPKPITDNQTTTSTIVVGEDICIGDVDVDLDLTHTFIGDLSIELTSPQGTTVRLHDRTGGSANDLSVRYDDEGFTPDGPGTLGDFDLERTAGTWTLSVRDNAGGDQGTLNSWSLRIATLGDDCPEPVLAYSFPLDVSPDWDVQGMWGFGTPTGGGGTEHGNADPTGGATGPNVYGYNLNGDYPNDMSPEHLTTAPIDCTGLMHTRLLFQRYLNVESNSYDHASVAISANGTNWTTVWENTGEITDSGWSLMNIDIGAIADGQSAVQVRWTMGETDGSWQYSGWNIDDVEIWAVTDSCLGDIDGSGDVGFSDLVALLATWGPCPGCPADLNGNGEVDFDDLLTVLAEWGVCP